jgi:hypothetical protein
MGMGAVKMERSKDIKAKVCSSNRTIIFIFIVYSPRPRKRMAPLTSTRSLVGAKRKSCNLSTNSLLGKMSHRQHPLFSPQISQARFNTLPAGPLFLKIGTAKV